MSAQDAVDNMRAKQGVPNSVNPNFVADQLQLIVNTIHNAGSFEHLLKPTIPIALTATWQVVVGDWVEEVLPEGASLDSASGVFVLSALGRWRPTLERIYHQHDMNPATPIEVSIKVQTSVDNINWTDTGFERSSFMSSATGNREPAVQSFSTDFFVDATSIPVYFRILVKASEDGANPTETELVLMKVTAAIASNVPVV